jgi:hypothetical protein
VTTDVAVGQMRQIEFIADEPGDWAFHCHKSHHTMNAMGHDVPTMIGVDHRGLVGKIQKIVPDYMLMGERGMGDMGAMEMPLPDNTFPMMTGQGLRPGRDGRHVHQLRCATRGQRLRRSGLVPAAQGHGAYEWQGAPFDAKAPASHARHRSRCRHRTQTRNGPATCTPPALTRRLP